MNSTADWSRELPLADLPMGEIAPPWEPFHPSWKILSEWDDPLAPRAARRSHPSGKNRVDTPDGAAVEFEDTIRWGRILLTGERSWRDYSVSCRLRVLQVESKPTMDNWREQNARAGIVFRVQTSRRYYQLCIEGKRRLVLYRRNDDDWTVLAEQDIDYSDQILTLEADVSASRLRAACPELGIEFNLEDDLLDNGRAGFRALGRCELFGLEIRMTVEQHESNEQAAAASETRIHKAAAALPEAVHVGSLDLDTDWSFNTALPITAANRHDLILGTPAGLVVRTWEGETLWEFGEQYSRLEISPATPARAARLYALVGSRPDDGGVADEAVVLHGATGKQIGRMRLPDNPVSNRPDVPSQWDFTYEVGTSEGPGTIDFMIKQDRGDGRHDVWAFDEDLNPLWHHRVQVPYGHHNSVHCADVNGDGKKEIIAGGTLLSSEGELIWEHDRFEEFVEIKGGRHYDAVLFQEPAVNEDDEPIVFLIGGSAGVYVVDAQNGKTIETHHIGHAQWGLPCKMRNDLPGLQFIIGTRWGNFGILTLFSNQGERLWTIQPDYILQESCPIQWEECGPQHFWLNTTEESQGLYNGHGELEQPLDPVRAVWKGHTALDVQSTAIRRSPTDLVDTLAVTAGNIVHFFSPG